MTEEKKNNFFVWLEMIKVEHTVFSAPFMLLAMFLAGGGAYPKCNVLFWCILALIGARSAAMGLNRLIDADYDAKNPRTLNRAIPSGLIERAQTLIFSVCSFVLMIFAAFQLPKICLWLSPLAVFWLSFYSFSKRFTWLCHWILGVAVAGAVLGGWLAVSPEFSWASIFLFFAVAMWIAGFDIVYSLMDKDFDSQIGLKSVPSKFGSVKALITSSFSHVLSIGCFFISAFLLFEKLNIFVFVGLICSIIYAAFNLFKQHLELRKDNPDIEKIFFESNSSLSLGFLMIVLFFAMFGKIFEG